MDLSRQTTASNNPADHRPGKVETANSVVLTRSDVEQRIKDHALVGYQTIYSVMKGITLANAAITLAILIGNYKATDNPPTFLSALPFLLTSFAGTVITYNGTHIGSLLTSWLPYTREVVLPFVLVIFEFTLFTLLWSAKTIVYWLPVYCFWGITASSIVWTVRSQLKRQEVEESLQKMREFYIEALRRDGIGSAITGIYGGTLFVAGRASYPSWLFKPFIALNGRGITWLWLIGWIAFVFLCVAIFQQSSDRRKMVALLQPGEVNNHESNIP